MATTTTNYGFDVPTSSDLVKNGATAISTLGQDIDTFLFRPFTNNRVIGGGFDIWQRGTSFTSFPATNTYTADRWQAYRGGFASGMTITRQVTGDTTNLPFIQYCARVARDSGNTSTQTLNLQTSIESANVYPLSGRAFVLSFYARAGANYSPTSSILAVSVLSGTSADMNYTSMSTFAGTTNATLTTTWQRFSVTGTFGATAISAGVGFNMTPTGTAGANDYFEVTGVQLEMGNQASPFTRAGGSIQQELAACQRYLPALIGSGNDLAGSVASTTSGGFSIRYNVTPRTNPTGITVSSLSDFRIYNSSSAFGNPTAITFNSNGKDYGTIAFTTTAGSPTIAKNEPCSLYAIGANASILFTGCEL